MANNKYARFFALLKQVNLNGVPYSKEEAVSDFTNRRTESLSDLSSWELQQLERTLSAMTATKTGTVPEGDEKRDKMRKGIIAIFKSIGRTSQDAITWAETKGVYRKKKAFNDYTGRELWQLIRNAEKMKKDFIQSVNKG